MSLFGQATPVAPTIPSEKIRLMRVHTLAEEVGELAQASGVVLVLRADPRRPSPTVDVRIDPDSLPILDQVADALADCQYFVDGTATAYGLDLEPFFNEVHRSNMDKLWRLDQLANMEPGWGAQIVGGQVGPVPTGLFVVKRADGKVMKPPEFVPPNLKAVLEAQKCRHDGFDPDKVNHAEV